MIPNTPRLYALIFLTAYICYWLFQKLQVTLPEYPQNLCDRIVRLVYLSHYKTNKSE